jgi:superkiller protein 3
VDPFKPEITPQTLPDLLDKARSLRENKWFDQALSIVKECLEKFPDHAPTNNLMGLLLIDQKKITDAEKYFNTAIAIDPKVPEYYFNLGRILVLKRNFVGAGNAYRQCVLLDPTHTLARYNFANLQEIQGKLPAALKEYQTLLRENPDFYKAHFSLGTVYFRQWLP